jgi:hypothetical protein
MNYEDKLFEIQKRFLTPRKLRAIINKDFKQSLNRFKGSGCGIEYKRKYLTPRHKGDKCPIFPSQTPKGVKR